MDSTPGFSVVGLGTGPLGEASVSAAHADRRVGAALAPGVTVFDPARSYTGPRKSAWAARAARGGAQRTA